MRGTCPGRARPRFTKEHEFINALRGVLGLNPLGVQDGVEDNSVLSSRFHPGVHSWADENRPRRKYVGCTTLGK